MTKQMSTIVPDKIVISGIGLTTPLGNSVPELRKNFLAGKSGITLKTFDHFGQLPVGECHYDVLKYQSKKSALRGSRPGSIAIFCANEAMADAHASVDELGANNIGIILGLAEHGSNETALELANTKDPSLWSPYHNFKIIGNSPSGEVSLNLGITGPHFTVSAACASGNLAIINAVQQILLGEVQYVLCGGVSGVLESFIGIHSFAAQSALAKNIIPSSASKPLDANRNGVVLANGGAVFFIEKLSSALKRNAHIYCEIESFAMNSDASDFILPLASRQAQCILKVLNKVNLQPSDVDLVNLHATATLAGDKTECEALRQVFSNSTSTHFNSSKGNIGHTMGASALIDFAANILSFKDNLIHPSVNIDQLDQDCHLPNIVINKPVSKPINRVLKNSFGMMGTNCCILYKRHFSP